MLINLINDMMDLAKTKRMKFDLEQLVERLFENMGYLAIEKKVQMNLKIVIQLLSFVKNINAHENKYT